MFLLIKLLKPFLLPPTLIAFGMIVAIVAVRLQRRRWATIALVTTLGVFYLLSIEPVAYALAWTLERPYFAVATDPAERVDAIVVLGGGARALPRPELGGSSWRRLWRGIEYHEALGGLVPFVYSGGSGDPFAPEAIEPDIALRIAMQAGVRETYMLLEKISRTTCENGAATRALLAERLGDGPAPRIALVTSAWHMRRAAGVFARLGMETLPIPADFMSGTLQWDPLSFLPSTSAFADSVVSIHEWIGLAGYRLSRCL